MRTLLVALVILSGCKDLQKKAEDDFEKDVNEKVTSDVLEQYEIVKRNGNKMEVCVHAGFVAAAYLQAKNEPEYKKWKAIEKTDCKKAGL